MGNTVQKGARDPVFDTVLPFSMQGSNYLFLRDDKTWQIVPVGDDGKIGVAADTGTFDFSYFPFCIYTNANRQCCLLALRTYKAGNPWWCREILPGGKMGELIGKGNLDMYYEQVFVF